MIERQVLDHPPLLVCHQEHRPMLWEATGNSATRYYVQCARCGVRTIPWASPEAAADAWAHRDVTSYSEAVA